MLLEDTLASGLRLHDMALFSSGCTLWNSPPLWVETETQSSQLFSGITLHF